MSDEFSPLGPAEKHVAEELRRAVGTAKTEAQRLLEALEDIDLDHVEDAMLDSQRKETPAACGADVSDGNLTPQHEPDGVAAERYAAGLKEIAGRDWQDEGGRIAAALARDALAGTGRFDAKGLAWLRDHARSDGSYDAEMWGERDA